MANRSLFSELRERKVVQAAAIYGAVAWGLTEVIVTIVEQLFLPQWVSTLAVIFFVVGFPIAMFLSWTFDVTADGIHRTAVSSRRGTASIALSMALLLAGTAGLFLLIKPSLDNGAPPEDAISASPNSVAVLPFDYSGPNSDDSYLGPGLSDELRDQLSRQGLPVKGRMSSNVFRNHNMEPEELSKQLGVDVLISGSFRRQKDSDKITVRWEMIDGKTGFVMLSERSQRTVAEVLAVQQAIVAAVTQELVPESDDAMRVAQPATLSQSAHVLMLAARHIEQQVRDEQLVDEKAMVEAVNLYSEAPKVDPTSAIAFSRLGKALLYLGDYGDALTAVLEARRLDPTLSEGWSTLGLTYWAMGLPGSGGLYQTALELNPSNPDALSNYASWLWGQAESRQADTYYRRALEQDPLSPKWRSSSAASFTI